MNAHTTPQHESADQPSTPSPATTAADCFKEFAETTFGVLDTIIGALTPIIDAQSDKHVANSAECVQYAAALLRTRAGEAINKATTLKRAGGDQ